MAYDDGGAAINLEMPARVPIVEFSITEYHWELIKVVTHIEVNYGSVDEVLAFDPWETYGSVDKGELTRRFEEHYRRQCEQWPNVVNMTGIYPSLMTGLTFIFGWELLLLAAGTDPAGFGEVTNRYGQTHFLIGNGDTRILLRGTREAIRREVERCISIGKRCPDTSCRYPITFRRTHLSRMHFSIMTYILSSRAVDGRKL